MTQTSPFRNREQKQQEREAKRQAVLRAAVRIFNERGFHGTSLDDVAHSLGVSKPTIYHYLGNKEQVLLHCVTRGLDQLMEAAGEARLESGLGIDRLRMFLRRYAEINMDDFGRCVILTAEESLSAEGRQEFRLLKRRVNDALQDMIEKAIADGSMIACNPRLLSYTVAGALNSPARWFSTDGPSTATQIASEMVDLLTFGFAPR
ncbi:TetR/AcrR family transcriptional regulator [uncultured Marinobacter sp.]|uniref:TetR/AcrR family transcriptional regulator n=1 Tax=uncultured Marinobacter sp. TaxID=187379 RepID=UPI0030D7B98C